jgi:hypothetical protein
VNPNLSQADRRAAIDLTRQVLAKANGDRAYASQLLAAEIMAKPELLQSLIRAQASAMIDLLTQTGTSA